MDKPTVKIFTLSTCSHCRAAKKYLSDCAINFTSTDVDMLKGDERSSVIEEVKKINPRCTFPTIIIGNRIIVGYKEDEIREALGL